MTNRSNAGMTDEWSSARIRVCRPETFRVALGDRRRADAQNFSGVVVKRIVLTRFIQAARGANRVAISFADGSAGADVFSECLGNADAGTFGISAIIAAAHLSRENLRVARLANRLSVDDERREECR